jgi:hypothetical protein
MKGGDTMPAMKSAHEVIQTAVTEWIAETDIDADSMKVMALISKLVTLLETERDNSYIRGRNSIQPPAPGGQQPALGDQQLELGGQQPDGQRV